jgi:hypothetical protein
MVGRPAGIKGSAPRSPCAGGAVVDITKNLAPDSHEMQFNIAKSVHDSLSKSAPSPHWPYFDADKQAILVLC